MEAEPRGSVARDALSLLAQSGNQSAETESICEPGLRREERGVRPMSETDREVYEQALREDGFIQHGNWWKKNEINISIEQFIEHAKRDGVNRTLERVNFLIRKHKAAGRPGQ